MPHGIITAHTLRRTLMLNDLEKKKDIFVPLSLPDTQLPLAAERVLAFRTGRGTERAQDRHTGDDGGAIAARGNADRGCRGVEVTAHRRGSLALCTTTSAAAAPRNRRRCRCGAPERCWLGKRYGRWIVVRQLSTRGRRRWHHHRGGHNRRWWWREACPGWHPSGLGDRILQWWWCRLLPRLFVELERLQLHDGNRRLVRRWRWWWGR